MENNGLPLENDISYDGDFLLAMTNVMEGTSDELRYVVAACCECVDERNLIHC